MKRDMELLKSKEFDLLIVGGGIYGATAAYDASLRGLSVALIEKNDFASATSSNSLKIIHGGLRYLQHLDFPRIRESIKERHNLMYMAPHLVHPMPCVMPTYGHAMKGPEVMFAGLMMNDIFSFDRNKGIHKKSRLPRGKVVSKDAYFEMAPEVEPTNINGGALWYDAHVHNSERLLLSFIHSAVDNGAVAANYIKAEKFIVDDNRVNGAQVVDEISGEKFDIKAKMTITTAGPWINNLFASLNGHPKPENVQLSVAMNLVVNRKLGDKAAFAAKSKVEFKDKDALISKGGRLLFLLPWRDVTLVGTLHKPYDGDAEDFHPTEEHVQEFLEEINSCLVPESRIKREEVVHQYAGLLPMAGVNDSGDVQLTKHYSLFDHQKDGLEGLISLSTVKFTTARDVTQKAVDVASKKIGKYKKSICASTRLWGGDLQNFDEFFDAESAKSDIDKSTLYHLTQTFGTKYQHVLDAVGNDSDNLEPLSDDTNVTKAEVLFGIRNEMAYTLTDIVMRRTELGTAGPASEQAINKCADIAAAELGWDENRKQQEIASLAKIYETVK